MSGTKSHPTLAAGDPACQAVLSAGFLSNIRSRYRATVHAIARFTLAVTLVALPTCQAGDLEAGMRAYEIGDYAKAEKFFARASYAGEARAAEILGFMYTLGPVLYPGVARDEHAATAHFAVAARAGQPGARYFLCTRLIPTAKYSPGRGQCHHPETDPHNQATH